MSILIWGTIKLLSSRYTLDARNLEEESQWTYGQILPVLLLIMPVLGVVGTLSVDTKPKLPENSTDSSQTAYLLQTLPSRDNLDMTNHHDSAVESNADSSQTVHLLKTHVSRDSLDMTDDRDSAGGMLPDWLVRNYYDAFWVNYCIVCECASIFAYGLIMFAVVFNFGDGMGLATQLNLLEFWVTEFAGVYSLVTVPLACFATFLVGLGLDKWLQQPGRKAGKHAVMLLLGGVIHTAYVVVVLVGPAMRMDDPGRLDVQAVRVVVITSITVGFYCIYALIAVWTVIRK